MRRKDREVTGVEKLLAIMNKCKVFSLAMSEGDMPYVVPLNFGYIYSQEKGVALYFHGAAAGKKLEILRHNPWICFEMHCEQALISGETACDHTYDFESLIGTGTAEIVCEKDEKKAALDAIMKQQTGKSGFTYAEKHIAAVAVVKIHVSELTGKIHSTPSY